MDRTLKERLIGAAVLVVLGVWLIPLVLDGPDAPPAGADEGLRLPAPEPGAEPETQTVEIDVARTEAAGPLPGASGVGAADESSAAAAPASAANTATAAADAIADPVLSPVPEPPASAPTKSPPPAAPKPAGDSDDAGWWVQLGSFGDESNARRQASRVSDFGFSPRISNYTASGRVMYRVRVGPHETRARAEADARSLSAHGFVAQLVAPE